jgi:hypothetical protein
MIRWVLSEMNSIEAVKWRYTNPVLWTTLAAAFLLRLCLSSGTFLNPDEALHFFIANRDSWAAAYKASLTMAHPPLLIFVLYCWRHIGTSEIMLRLPLVFAGTAFCWFFFKWLEVLFGSTTALVGLLFAALLPPLAILSAEVRQYELLLLFLMAGSWLLERAFAENSLLLTLFSAVCLYLALLSHYSAVWFVATLGIYSLLHLMRYPASPKLIVVWVIGQLGALALLAFLYATHLSKIKRTTMAEQAFDGWLYKSYFHSGHDHSFTFILVRTFSVFQFLLGQSVIGDLACLLFIAGIVLLWRGRYVKQRRDLAILLTLPFVLNSIAALLDVYPYGGTRHSVFLGIFGLAGISICIAQIAQERVARALGLTLGIIILCAAFRSVRHPYIERADQSSANMAHSVAFIENNAAPSDIIFVDYESGLELGHYLCRQSPIQYEDTAEGFLVFRCNGRTVVSTINDLWAFDPQMFVEQWKQLQAHVPLQAGTRVWVIQAGWIVTLAVDLKAKYPLLKDVPVQSFGKNIQILPLDARGSYGF